MIVQRYFDNFFIGPKQYKEKEEERLKTQEYDRVVKNLFQSCCTNLIFHKLHDFFPVFFTRDKLVK